MEVYENSVQVAIHDHLQDSLDFRREFSGVGLHHVTLGACNIIAVSKGSRDDLFVVLDVRGYEHTVQVKVIGGEFWRVISDSLNHDQLQQVVIAGQNRAVALANKEAEKIARQVEFDAAQLKHLTKLEAEKAQRKKELSEELAEAEEALLSKGFTSFSSNIPEFGCWKCRAFKSVNLKCNLCNWTVCGNCGACSSGCLLSGSGTELEGHWLRISRLRRLKSDFSAL